MIQIVREVSADVVKRGSTRAVYAKQNDLNSRFLNVRIQEEGKDLKVDTTSTVVLNVERPDRQENMFYGTVNEDGTVKIPLTSWMLELEGTLMCDVSIIDEDPAVAKLTTMQFNIFVEAAVVADESFIETEDYSVIVDLLKRTTAAADVAEKAKEASVQTVAACEEATENANKAAEVAMGAAGGITTVETNSNTPMHFWVGSQEEYDDQKETMKDGTFCIVYDDKTFEIMSADITQLKTHLNEKTIWVSNTTLAELRMQEMYKKQPNETFARYCVSANGSYLFYEIHKATNGWGHMERIQYGSRYFRAVTGGKDDVGNITYTFEPWQQFATVQS